MVRICSAFLLVISAFVLCSQASAQARELEYYQKLKQLKTFESKRQDVESLFEYLSSKDSLESGGSKTVYLEPKGANLDVYYSTGRCSEHHSKLGFDIAKDTVIGVHILFYEEIPYSSFDFDLRKFRRYQENDNNSIHYTNESLGIELIGGKDKVRSIEFSGSEELQEKYRCK